MVFFPNHKLELWDYTESSTEFNSYLEPKKEYHLQETIPCDFQPMSAKDSLQEFGEILEDTFKVYIDSNVEINPKMILRLTGEIDTYEILGTPMNNNHLLHVQHIKLVLKKQRKPTRLEVV